MSEQFDVVIVGGGVGGGALATSLARAGCSVLVLEKSSGMLVEGADGWPDDVQTIGSEGDVHFLVFPQGRGRVRLYLGYASEQQRRLAGAQQDPTLILPVMAPLFGPDNLPAEAFDESLRARLFA